MADYSATESMLGYLYQARYALHAALARMQAGSKSATRIEQLDDISFDAPGTPTELLQLKHHTNSEKALTDSSADIWKTIRVWLDTPKGHEYSDDQTVRYLITTGKANPGSAAYCLRDTRRDIEEAYESLKKAAEESENEKQQPTYEAFLNLPPLEAKAFLSSIIVIDREPQIGELEESLKQVLYFASSTTKRDAFLHRLEGWWFQRCVQHLKSKGAPEITVAEIQEELDQIREEFRRENLPINPEIFDIVGDESADKCFVRQLALIDVVGPRIAYAVSNYVRAFAQRSEWIRDDLVAPGELSRYESRLQDAWKARFWEVKEEVGESAAEEEKVKAARALYKWVEQEADIRIREMCREQFVMLGTYHELADQRKVGWHPDFEARLVSLLEGESL